MIRYALICSGEHSFESWFRDSAAFDTLVQTGAVTCPVCGTSAVSKALMAPSVVTSRKKARPVSQPAPEAPAAASPPSEAPAAVLLGERERRLRDMLRTLHREITEKADNVGRDFADEARRIHEGKAPQRSIYGEATRPEVNALLEEGVPLLPMPPSPDDGN